jgi:hypothetical protein
VVREAKLSVAAIDSSSSTVPGIVSLARKTESSKSRNPWQGVRFHGLSCRMGYTVVKYHRQNLYSCRRRIFIVMLFNCQYAKDKNVDLQLEILFKVRNHPMEVRRRCHILPSSAKPSNLVPLSPDDHSYIPSQGPPVISTWPSQGISAHQLELQGQSTRQCSHMHAMQTFVCWNIVTFLVSFGLHHGQYH